LEVILLGEVVFFRSNGDGNSNTSIIIPSTYEQHWEDDFTENQLLFDINKIYETKGYPNVMTTEFIIKNNSDVNNLNLIIKDKDITIADVTLEKQETQKYLLGISCNIKVYVKGDFTATLYIGTY